MKKLTIYVGCTSVLGLALVTLLSGGWWSLAGILILALIYVSGELYPHIWQQYWLMNRHILKNWGCD